MELEVSIKGLKHYNRSPMIPYEQDMVTVGR